MPANKYSCIMEHIPPMDGSFPARLGIRYGGNFLWPMVKEEKTLLYYTNNKNFTRRRAKREVAKGGDMLKVVGDQIVLSAASASSLEEDEGITSNTYRKKKEQGRTRWNKYEDEAFFKALECCGCEFSIMNILYPGRTRNNLREKYKRELRQNRSRVEAALSNFKRFDKEKFWKLKEEIGNGWG